MRVNRLHRLGAHLVLAAASLAAILPFMWMILGSLKSMDEFYTKPPLWIPRSPHWSNYAAALSAAPFARFFFNSVVVTSTVVGAQIVTSCLAGYALARIRFRGRDAVFVLILSTMMIPYHAAALPSFLILRKLGWIDTYFALTVPFFAYGFGIFLMRQAFLGIPAELEDSARIDGAGHGRILWSIMLPLSGPSIVTMVLLSGAAVWNNYFWPLIFTTSLKLRTLPLGLAMFRTQEGTAQWNLLMAGSVFVAAPMLLLFIAGQRYFVQGVASTGLKG